MANQTQDQVQKNKDEIQREKFVMMGFGILIGVLISIITFLIFA